MILVLHSDRCFVRGQSTAEAFRDAALLLAKNGTRLYEIASNHEILMTSAVPTVSNYNFTKVKVAIEKPNFYGFF